MGIVRFAPITALSSPDEANQSWGQGECRCPGLPRFLVGASRLGTTTHVLEKKPHALPRGGNLSPVQGRTSGDRIRTALSVDRTAAPDHSERPHLTANAVGRKGAGAKGSGQSGEGVPHRRDGSLGERPAQNPSLRAGVVGRRRSNPELVHDIFALDCFVTSFLAMTNCVFFGRR